MLIVLQPERAWESAAFGEREETCELLERAGEAERAGSRQPDERAWSMGVGSQLRNKEAEITCSVVCRVRVVAPGNLVTDMRCHKGGHRARYFLLSLLTASKSWGNAGLALPPAAGETLLCTQCRMCVRCAGGK